MISIIPKILTSLVNLVYPNLCEICYNPLVRGEKLFCISCLYRMPLTNFWNHTDNQVEQLFWGKVKLERACSLFYFRKGSVYRPLLHKLKYQGRKDIGIRLGEELGRKLQSSGNYADIDYIVPIPLHVLRERKRGYNQSEQIAMGVSGVLGVPVSSKNLYRSKYTETQTRKGRMERWVNVSSVFALHNNLLYENCHILLIDDVITTGSTMEACVEILSQSCNCKVSVATIGFASVN